MVKIGSLPGIKTFPARFKNPKLGWQSVGIGFLFLTFSLSSSVWGAMTFTFSGAPLTVERDEEFEVQVSLLSAPQNRTYFLRAAFFQEGTSQYFGYTLNSQGIWHNQVAGYDQFLEINTGEEGKWEGFLRTRADLEAAGFQGPGEYLFKVGRYTEGGSLSWSENEVGITILLAPTPTPSSTPTVVPLASPTPEVIFSPTPTVTPTPASYTGGGIFLNEFMAYPAEGEEWVEIKNGNDFGVGLVNWFMDDVSDGGSKPFQFSTTIPAKGLAVVYIGTRLNNSGDVVRLLGRGGEEIESYPYTSEEEGYSFAKDEEGNWRLTSDPTPGEENRIISLPSPTPVPSPTWPPASSPAASPTGTSFFPSFPTPTVLGLVDDDQAATTSAGLTDLVCPLIEELEANSSVLEDSYPGESQDEHWLEPDPKQKPVFNFFCLLGLGTMASSFGFFLKEAGILIKWKHGLVAKV